MKRLFAWLSTQDRNDKTYFLGLLMLFLGLTWLSSVFMALTVVGAAMALESAITSYLVAVLNSRKQ
jgi:hypothetical protein